MADYPYTYARVSAKRAKLLDVGDYDELLKLEPNGIGRRLEEGDYEKEINELGSRYDGAELVELALNRNLSRTLSDIIGYAPEKLEKVIKVYLRRYDLTSFKRLLRWKRSDSEENIEDLLIPAGSISKERFQELAEKDFEEILECINFKDSLVDYRSKLRGLEDLGEVERALDNAYYCELEELIERSNSTQFQRFIRNEIEFENLVTVLRLKKYGADRERIEEVLGDRMVSMLVKKVIGSDDREKAISAIEESKGVEIEGGVEELEHSLEKVRLEKAIQMVRTEPLGFTSILGYILAKIIEVRNLRVVIRAKETGIQNRETIRGNLVTA